MWVMATPAALMLRWMIGPKVGTGGRRRKSVCKSVEEKEADIMFSRFCDEYAVIESDEDMSEEEKMVFRESISLLENFMLFCDEEKCVLRHFLTLALTARNCWHGYGEDFPEDAVPYIIAESRWLIADNIHKSAVNKRQTAYALSAIEDLIEVLGAGMSLDSIPISTNCDSELGGKQA